MCGGPFCGLFWPFAYGVNHVPDNGREYPYTESALEILKCRYANSEISKEEFEEKKKELR